MTDLASHPQNYDCTVNEGISIKQEIVSRKTKSSGSIIMTIDVTIIVIIIVITYVAIAHKG